MIQGPGIPRLRTAFAAGGAVALLAGATAAAEHPPAVVAASCFLGPAGADLDTETFAAALAHAGVPAKAAGKTTSWQKPRVDGGGWITGVTAGFGERAHAYAFAFSGSGTLQRFAHVPYAKTTLPGGERVWFAPVARLASALADGRSELRHGRPTIRIRVSRCDAADGGGTGADLDIYEVIAWAAACEAGWTPVPATATLTAALEVEPGIKSATLRLWCDTDGGRREIVKRSVPEDDVHEVLRRCFACLVGDTPATDFIRLGADAVILAAAPGRLFFTADGGLRDLDAGVGRGLWTADGESAAVRGGGACVAWPAADGKPALVRWRPHLAVFDPADGRPRPAAPVAPASSWSFDLSDTRAVVASGMFVAAFDDGRETWRHRAADSVTCGPAIAGGLVIAGTDAGDLFAVDAESGMAAWTLRLDPGLIGRAVPIGGRVLVFARSSDTVVAVDAATGRLAWSRPLGDAWVKPPIATAGGVLVATKSNRVLLLDPGSGSPLAERRLASWIGDLAVLPARPGEPAGRVACLVRDGTVVLLGGVGLEPVAERKLDAGPGFFGATGLLVAPKFPTSWPGPKASHADGEDLEADLVAADCLVAGDEDGYCWIVPLSRLTEERR